MAHTPRMIIAATVMRFGGDWDAIYEAIRKKEAVPDEEIFQSLKQLKCKYVTIVDEEYPESIRRHCPKPPFALFYQGDIHLLDDPCRLLTVVGSRTPTPYAYGKTKELCTGIANKGYVVVSGLARGIDTAAAEATARLQGKAVAFLGNGFDHVYPPENKQYQSLIAHNGLLISEYPPSTPPSARNFPARNRLMAAVSQATFIGEAKAQSGTLITCAFALEFNRDIGALPFHAGEDIYNNNLIKQGCALIETVDDLELLLNSKIAL